jgi:hypothetical protein
VIVIVLPIWDNEHAMDCTLGRLVDQSVVKSPSHGTKNVRKKEMLQVVVCGATFRRRKQGDESLFGLKHFRSVPAKIALFPSLKEIHLDG